MKRYIILFAIFITAIFYYPVFAYADRVGFFISESPVSGSMTLFLLGSGLFATAGLARRLIPTK